MVCYGQCMTFIGLSPLSLRLHICWYRLRIFSPLFRVFRFPSGLGCKPYWAVARKIYDFTLHLREKKINSQLKGRRAKGDFSRGFFRNKNADVVGNGIFVNLLRVKLTKDENITGSIPKFLMKQLEDALGRACVNIPWRGCSEKLPDFLKCFESQCFYVSTSLSAFNIYFVWLIFY